MGVETWTKQAPFEELKGAKLALCLSFFYFIIWVFPSVSSKQPSNQCDQSSNAGASARSLLRVKCQVAKLMRILGLKARNVTLK